MAAPKTKGALPRLNKSSPPARDRDGFVDLHKSWERSDGAIAGAFARKIHRPVDGSLVLRDATGSGRPRLFNRPIVAAEFLRNLLRRQHHQPDGFLIRQGTGGLHVGNGQRVGNAARLSHGG